MLEDDDLVLLLLARVLVEDLPRLVGDLDLLLGLVEGFLNDRLRLRVLLLDWLCLLVTALGEVLRLLCL